MPYHELMAELMRNVRYRYSRRRPRLIGRTPKVLAGVTLALLAARAALPYAVLRYVNRTLDSLPGYRGSVEDVDIKLWRGAYQIKEAKLEKADGESYAPFFYARNIDVSVEWPALLRGSIVGEVVLEQPALNFIQGPTEETSQTEVDRRWQDRVDELVPLRVNRFEIIDGAVTYRNHEKKPPVDVALRQVNVVATNLTNAHRRGDELPAAVQASAAALSSARLMLRMRAAPLADTPTFDLDASLRGVKLAELNDFLRAFTGFDAEAGTLDLFLEAAAADGAIKGYVKPMFEDLKLVAWNDKKKGPLKLFKEAVAAALGELLENQPKDRVAARIPVGGPIKDPKAGLWPAVASLLRNAFVTALRPGLERSVGPGDVQKKEKKS